MAVAFQGAPTRSAGAVDFVKAKDWERAVAQLQRAGPDLGPHGRTALDALQSLVPQAWGLDARGVWIEPRTPFDVAVVADRTAPGLQAIKARIEVRRPHRGLGVLGALGVGRGG